MKSWIALMVTLWALPAQAASISLSVIGTDFGGGPAFVIEADNVPLGVGIVQNFERPQLYSYTLDDAALASAETIAVRFVNDRFEEGLGDRNLLVVSLSVNGTPFAGDAISVHNADGPVPGPWLLTSGHRAIIVRPETGWPQR